jgi:hypothetical protein
LVLGIWEVINVLPEAEPFGYGAGGVGIVAFACGMGVLVVLLLLLLIGSQHIEQQMDIEPSVTFMQPSMRKYWIILLTYGWAGTFWAIIGIARVWHWADILLGLAILSFACIAAVQIARIQQSHR